MCEIVTSGFPCFLCFPLVGAPCSGKAWKLGDGARRAQTALKLPRPVHEAEGGAGLMASKRAFAMPCPRRTPWRKTLAHRRRVPAVEQAARGPRRRRRQCRRVNFVIRVPSSFSDGGVAAGQAAADPQFLRRLFYAKRMSEPTSASTQVDGELIEWMLADWMVEDDNQLCGSSACTCARWWPRRHARPRRATARGVRARRSFRHSHVLVARALACARSMPSPTRARALAAEAAAGGCADASA